MIRKKNARHHTVKGFRNISDSYEEKGFLDLLKWMVERQKARRNDKGRYYPLDIIDDRDIPLTCSANGFTVTWVGHSSVYTCLGGLSILTDPIWSHRASPLSWAGPKRYTPPGLAFDELPDIDVVLISHDHYDHLDKRTLKRLGNRPLYIVPLGVGKVIEKFGITNYQELDWWDKAVYGGVTFTCTPAQHFSGRSLFSKNETLWCGWAAHSPAGSFFFGGDTGYFEGFKDIGRRLGPFDIAMLPIGAYLPEWMMSPVHIGPDQAVNISRELNASILMPIHWGTFELADDPPMLPPTELIDYVVKEELAIERYWLLKHGETRDVRRELDTMHIENADTNTASPLLVKGA